jgi:hypothetical protein
MPDRDSTADFRQAHCVSIEDIAGRRRREGIEDVELRDAIRGLAVGDVVRVTLRADHAPSGETVDVRITAVDGDGFHGALAGRPASKGLAGMVVGAAIDFTADHIHSLPNRKTVTGRRRPDRQRDPLTSFRQEEGHG